MRHLKTKVVHSQSEDAWDVLATIPGINYKIASCPYLVIEECPELSDSNKDEALEYALFISASFNTRARSKR